MDDIPRFMNLEDLAAYRAGIKFERVPVMCERVNFKVEGSSAESHRVDGFYRPVLPYRVPTKPRYGVIRSVGPRKILVSRHGSRVLASADRLNHRKHHQWDGYTFERQWREEWDEEERLEVAAQGRIELIPCPPEEATHVGCYAVGWHCRRLDRVELTGELCWPEEKAKHELDRWLNFHVARRNRFSKITAEP